MLSQSWNLCLPSCGFLYAIFPYRGFFIFNFPKIWFYLCFLLKGGFSQLNFPILWVFSTYFPKVLGFLLCFTCHYFFSPYGVFVWLCQPIMTVLSTPSMRKVELESLKLQHRLKRIACFQMQQCELN